MNHEHDNGFKNDDSFEHDLRRGLSALAANCPAGPSGDAVLARLHQRTRWRRIATGAACAAAFAVAVSVIALQRPQSQPVTPPVDHVIIEPVTPAKQPQPTGPTREAVDDTTHGFVITPRREAVDGAEWSNQVTLNLGQPANETDVPAATQPIDLDWNLSLSLSLASHVSDVSWSSLRFDSPAWR